MVVGKTDSLLLDDERLTCLLTRILKRSNWFREINISQYFIRITSY